MSTVVIRETGELMLPRETLEESHIMRRNVRRYCAWGQILLLDRAQVRRRVEEIGQEMQESLGKALRQAGKDASFAGLNWTNT